MRFFLTILLVLPLAAWAGQLLGPDIHTSTAAAKTAIENAERHKAKATPPPKAKKSREQRMREARQRMDAADRERERRGGAFAR